MWADTGAEHDTRLVWTASCLCFFVFFRAGEMTVNGPYHPSVHLSFSDLGVDDSRRPSFIKIFMKQSKTDPFRKGVALFVGASGTDLCPVASRASRLPLHERFHPWAAVHPQEWPSFISGPVCRYSSICTGPGRFAIGEVLWAQLSYWGGYVSSCEGHRGERDSSSWKVGKLCLPALLAPPSGSTHWSGCNSRQTLTDMMPFVSRLYIFYRLAVNFFVDVIAGCNTGSCLAGRPVALCSASLLGQVGGILPPWSPPPGHALHMVGRGRGRACPHFRQTTPCPRPVDSEGAGGHGVLEFQPGKLLNED